MRRWKKERVEKQGETPAIDALIGDEEQTRWKKKRIESQRAKPHTPTPPVDALIGEEDQTRKEKREQRKKQEGSLQLS